VPDPATYTGDFSGSSTIVKVPSAALVSSSVLFQNCPGGVAPAGIVQGSAFPGNKIPSCMLDANAQALLGAGIFQKPNGTNDSGQPPCAGGGSNPTNVKDEIARVDHQFNSKFSVFGH